MKEYQARLRLQTSLGRVVSKLKRQGSLGVIGPVTQASSMLHQPTNIVLPEIARRGSEVRQRHVFAFCPDLRLSASTSGTRVDGLATHETAIGHASNP